MNGAQTVDGVLVQWGERLFYPSNRIVKTPSTPRLDTLTRRKAAVIRGRIVATVVRRAPQVMVKVTGGGRGMNAIAAHLRYISKNGRLQIEDDRELTYRGKESMRDLVEQWRRGGAWIPDEGHRREAFNIMLSMPHGTSPLAVQQAARAFAKIELAGHRYVMVLHDHQANPHVHLSVRATGVDGSRLNPRKTDLHRWRESFAERLRELGIEAEASRQATRGEGRRSQDLWRLKAKEDGRLSNEAPASKVGDAYAKSRSNALVAWANIFDALRKSDRPEDQDLAARIAGFVKDSTYGRQVQRNRQRDVVLRDRQRPMPQPAPIQRARTDRDIKR